MTMARMTLTMNEYPSVTTEASAWSPSNVTPPPRKTPFVRTAELIDASAKNPRRSEPSPADGVHRDHVEAVSNLKIFLMFNAR